MISFTLQAGTGLGTQWGYYYDVEQDKFSDVFQCIYSQGNGKVAYAQNNKVIVRDIFNEAKYYKEFVLEQNNLSKVAEPIKGVKFDENENFIEVTYLTGDDFKEVNEKFFL